MVLHAVHAGQSPHSHVDAGKQSEMSVEQSSTQTVTYHLINAVNILITLGNVYRNSPNYLSSTAEEVCQLALAMKTLSWRHHRVALGDSDRAAWRFR